MSKTKICTNCNKLCVRLWKTWCNACYAQYRKFGDPNYREAAIPKVLTEQQSNIIIGSMLGDGSLRRVKIEHNTNLIIGRASADRKYLEWERSKLHNLVSDFGISDYDVHDKRTNETYYKSVFLTRSLVVLNRFHDEWYKDKIKIIPQNLKLNAEIISVWFCDDGHINNNGSINRFRISLATNSFSKDEVYFLCSLLNDRYNEIFSVITINKEKEQYVINGADSASRAMITDIDLVYPEGMQRKRLWDDPATCYYQNQPVRRKSINGLKLDRFPKIVEFIKNHDEFYVIDLARAIDIMSNSQRGKKNASSNIKSYYLRDYIKDGLIIELGREKGINYTKGNKFQITPLGKQFFSTK